MWALRQLQMTSLNRPRLDLLLAHYWERVSIWAGPGDGMQGGDLSCMPCCARFWPCVAAQCWENIQSGLIRIAFSSGCCAAGPAPSLAPPASARCLQGAVLAPAAIAAQESLLAPPLRRLGQLLGGGRRDPEIAVAPPLASLVRQLLLGSSFCYFVH